jgi:hypothetical protein
MISSSPTALITMHNVKRFLQESMSVLILSLFIETECRFGDQASNLPPTLVPVPLKRVTQSQKTSLPSTESAQALIPPEESTKALHGTLLSILSKR